jgi:D-glycero-alpha-D-manno-heptose-7-phosphate kinase
MVSLRSRAPLRISFAGGGTDVSPFPESEGGAVLSATIDRYAHASLESRDDDQISVHSVDFDVTVRIGPDEDPADSGELELVRAAIANFGRGPRGYDLLLESGAPPGSGLGSSSTVMVALVKLLSAHQGSSLSEYEVANLAWRIERLDLGIVGGKQDHYAATFGGVNFIEFDGEHVLVNPLRVADETINELQHNLLLAYTGLTRASSEIIQDQTGRVNVRNSDVLGALRMQKSLATEMKRALLKGKLHDFGELMNVAWEHKKRMSPKISNPLIEEAHDLAMKAGALGGKVTGAGGGGYVLLYAPYQAVHSVRQALVAAGFPVDKVAFTAEGAIAWETR